MLSDWCIYINPRDLSIPKEGLCYHVNYCRRLAVLLPDIRT